MLRSKTANRLKSNALIVTMGPVAKLRWQAEIDDLQWALHDYWRRIQGETSNGDFGAMLGLTESAVRRVRKGANVTSEHLAALAWIDKKPIAAVLAELVDHLLKPSPGRALRPRPSRQPAGGDELDEIGEIEEWRREPGPSAPGGGLAASDEKRYRRRSVRSTK